MTHLTLATIIRKRVPLVPREATALTLAVAAQWDRERAHEGSHDLPEPSGIRLHRTGEISFHPRTGGGSISLSALLGQLLGIDEPTAPRRPVPGGLLITLAGRLGPMDLPSQTEDGFRAALTRFADPDPTVLQKVFKRAARLYRGPRHREPSPSRVHLPDRRRQAPAVTDLRREIRQLEQQVFESVGGQQDSRASVAGTVRPRLVWAGAAAVASALVAAIALTASAERPARIATDAPPVNLVDEPVAPARSAAAPQLQQPAARINRSDPDKRLTGHPVTRRAATRRTQPAVTRTVSFAGGTRSIGWLPARPSSADSVRLRTAR